MYYDNSASHLNCSERSNIFQIIVIIICSQKKHIIERAVFFFVLAVDQIRKNNFCTLIVLYVLEARIIPLDSYHICLS